MDKQINIEDNNSNNINSNSNTIQYQSKRCYTCKPRGKVRKHIIGQSLCKKYYFHHDMNHRPVILVTPTIHIETINQIEDLNLLFSAIRDFCAFWNIEDYQISFNHGSWKLNEHFHVKIKINDKIANRMRGDHFKRIKLEDNYKI